MTAVKRSAEQSGLTNAHAEAALKRCRLEPSNPLATIRIGLMKDPNKLITNTQVPRQPLESPVPEITAQDVYMNDTTIRHIRFYIACMDGKYREDPWLMMVTDLSRDAAQDSFNLLPLLGRLQTLVIRNWTSQSEEADPPCDLSKLDATRGIPLLWLQECSIPPWILIPLVEKCRPRRLKMSRFVSRWGSFWVERMMELGYVAETSCAVGVVKGDGEQLTVFEGEYVLAEKVEECEESD